MMMRSAVAACGTGFLVTVGIQKSLVGKFCSQVIGLLRGKFLSEAASILNQATDSAAYSIHLAENTGYTGLRESTFGLEI
jgi:hypothetical protein